MPNYMREEVSPSKSNIMGSKVKPPKVIKKDLATTVQGKTKTQTNYNHNIKCFKCLGNGHI